MKINPSIIECTPHCLIVKSLSLEAGEPQHAHFESSTPLRARCHSDMTVQSNYLIVEQGSHFYGFPSKIRRISTNTIQSILNLLKDELGDEVSLSGPPRGSRCSRMEYALHRFQPNTDTQGSCALF